MNKQYAVFDWDNTIRDGFTLFDWIDYLVEQEILSGSIKSKIDDLSKQYKSKDFSHDEYAHLACRAYTKEICSLRFDDLKCIASQYIEQDRHHIFNGMNRIFDILYDNDIDIIVISGAPRIILDFYKKEFHIRSVYAFKERVVKGYFNGQVAYNHGYNKKKTMLQLENKYGIKPLFGFGDSNSDIPLLEEAVHPFAMNNNIGTAIRINTFNNSIRCSYIQDILHIIQSMREINTGNLQ